MIAVAENVTEVPLHEGFKPPVMAMETDGVTLEFIVNVTLFDDAVTGLAQLKLEVMLQVIIWPFVKALELYVGLLVPTLTPLTCHW